jgi:LAS superfamily LD-carboxypeptidase LdcB
VHRILKHHPYWIYGVAAALLAALLGGAAYAWNGRTSLDSVRKELSAAEESVSQLQEKLKSTEEERDRLQELLRQAADENAAFGKRVEELATSVNFLDKLSKTDRELLQKYSSVYFLSENFIPDPLVPIDDELLARSGNAMIHGDILPYLRSMMRAATADGSPLLILSAYRSFGEQSAVKSNYKVTYGAGANKFSADQGYSEHQLGSTVDFVTPENPSSLTTSFSTTPQYRWLLEHAHEYGFVISYPEGNAHFQFEPWHWRFVGVDLARYLHNDGKYFYDLDQREINAYLARIFD